MTKNAIELRAEHRARLRRRLPKTPVTIIVGLICEDAIVLASDSRTTNTDGTIRDDAEKLTIITFADGKQALVAQAGNADLSLRAVEILSKTAKNKTLTDYRSVASLAQDAIAELKHELMHQYHGFGFSLEEFAQYLEKYSFELMIAHYHDGDPYIFTLDFGLGSANRARPPFVAIGCSHTLATFLLSWMDVSKMRSGVAFTAAIYTIREVKKIDARCGGPVQVRTIMKHNFSILDAQMTRDALNAIEKQFSESDTTSSVEWQNRMLKIIKDASSSAAA